MSDLPRLLPGPNKVTLVLWYGPSNDLRGVVYESIEFEFEFKADRAFLGGEKMTVEMTRPSMVETKAWIREQE